MSFKPPNMAEIEEESDVQSKVSLTERLILIIDDSYDMLNNLKKVISKAILEFPDKRFKIKTGKDGIDFLKFMFDAVYDGRHVQVAFIDKNMTYLNGDRSVAILNEVKLNVPRLVWTSEDVASENDLFITKPTTIETVVEIIEKILDEEENEHN